MYTVCGKETEKLWIEKDAVKYSQSNMQEYVQAICEYWHYSDVYLNSGSTKDNEIGNAFMQPKVIETCTSHI